MGRNVTSGVIPVPVAVGLINQTITGSTSAASNRAYYCDTASSAITLTLPATANQGDIVRIFDLSNTFDTNNLTVARNGNPIMGATEDLVVSTEGAAFDLVFYDAVKGWRIFSI
jgi:hypothetical protein